MITKLKNKPLIKYKVVIDGDVAKWTGYIHSTNHEDAFDMATDVAIGLGGDFFDVLMCYEVSEEDKE
jgi:hypothetical protein